MNANECEACGGESGEFVHVGMLEVAGVGGHFLCVECVREMNLADELLDVRVTERASSLIEQALIRYTAAHADHENMTNELTKAARNHIRATTDYYRASVQWILSRRSRADEESEAA